MHNMDALDELDAHFRCSSQSLDAPLLPPFMNCLHFMHNLDALDELDAQLGPTFHSVHPSCASSTDNSQLVSAPAPVPAPYHLHTGSMGTRRGPGAEGHVQGTWPQVSWVPMENVA
jgi:hypothetical protein